MAYLRETLKALKGGAQYVAGISTLGLSTLILYPDIWGLKSYRKMVQMYRDGEPVPVDEESKQLGQQVFDKVLWDPLSEANVEFFTIYGQDIRHRGSTFSSHGAIIGIPTHFKNRSIVDIEKDKITLNNASIDWNSPSGQQLMDSLILSEKARQFAIARELFYVHTFHMYVKAALVGVSFISAYWMGAATNAVYGLSRRLPAASRAVVYGLFAGMGATVYCFASDNYSWYRDRKSDRKAAQLGLDYAEGGVEFYNKLLLRNIALRSLAGQEGSKRYTAYGNEIHFWRSPSVPLTSRRDKMQELVKSLQDADNVPKVSTAVHSA